MSSYEATHNAASNPIVQLYVRIAALLDSVPWSILVIPMRVAAFSVFWRSGSVKLDDWAGTLSLFADEYKVPLLPPEFAAYMATTMELGCSTLILLGLATRFAGLGLIGMIATIQIFVYPMAWPDHIQWLAFLIPIMLRVRMGDRFVPGPWTLGRKYKVLGWIASIEIIVICLYFIMPIAPAGVPFSKDFSWVWVNYAPIAVGGTILLVGLWWVISARRWFTGPIRQIEVPTQAAAVD